MYALSLLGAFLLFKRKEVRQMKYLNSEGYKDITAGKAIESITRLEKRKIKKQCTKHRARAEPKPRCKSVISS